jgi:hypothetical protein
MFPFFYVTDGNIMYLTDASRSLISCVIQHYAPVVGWGGGGVEEQMHNVDYDPVEILNLMSGSISLLCLKIFFIYFARILNAPRFGST